MPQIVQYDAQREAVPQPTDRAVESHSIAARRIAGLYGDAASALIDTGHRTAETVKTVTESVNKYVASVQINNGAKALADIVQAKTVQWNAKIKNATPEELNNPAFAEEFRKSEVEPVLDKWRSSFTMDHAQAWAETHLQSTRNHFFAKTAGDQSAMAGHVVQANLMQTMNLWANTVSTDPRKETIDYALEQSRGSVEGLVKTSAALTPEHAARISSEFLQKAQEHIVKAGIYSAIQGDSVSGMKLAQMYPKYVNEAEIRQFDAWARSVERQKAADARMEKAQQKEDDRQSALDRRAEYLNSTYDLATGAFKFDPGIGIKIFTDDLLQRHPSIQNETLRLIEREANFGLTKRDAPGLFAHFLLGTQVREGMPGHVSVEQIYAAMADGRLTRESGNFIESRIRRRDQPETREETHMLTAGLRIGERVLNPSSGPLGRWERPQGQEDYARFEQGARYAYLTGLKAGKRPEDMLLPGGKDYIFTDKFIQAFKHVDAAPAVPGLPGSAPRPAPPPPRKQRTDLSPEAQKVLDALGIKY